MNCALLSLTFAHALFGRATIPAHVDEPGCDSIDIEVRLGSNQYTRSRSDSFSRLRIQLLVADGSSLNLYVGTPHRKNFHEPRQRNHPIGVVCRQPSLDWAAEYMTARTGVRAFFQGVDGNKVRPMNGDCVALCAPCMF